MSRKIPQIQIAAPKRFRVRVEGHTAEWLYVDPLALCGDIADGVGLENGAEGPWVISFHDLRRIVRAAERARR